MCLCTGWDLFHGYANDIYRETVAFHDLLLDVEEYLAECNRIIVSIPGFFDSLKYTKEPNNDGTFAEHIPRLFRSLVYNFVRIHLLMSDATLGGNDKKACMGFYLLSHQITKNTVRSGARE